MAVVGTLLIVGATIVVRRVYSQNLKPASSSQTTQLVTIKDGESADSIATQLQQAGIIRSSWAFKLYVSSKEVRSALQAGTYELQPSLSVSEIVSRLTHGKIATNLVTILPGQRIDQVHTVLIQDGFTAADVDQALNPTQYADSPVLVDKPDGASLEGYLYPNSYQKTSSTTATTIVKAALTEMQKHLTPDVRAAFAQQHLSVYQGITLASIVEKEVSKSTDRAQAAQVFIKRLQIGMNLGSDVTAYYGSIAADKALSLQYDSPYNTRLHTGLPPTPISNISDSSLNAVAHPAQTDWLYFVAGDDGTTYFSKTLADHEALTQQYCKKLCSTTPQ
jgi:UPF0755 protein